MIYYNTKKSKFTFNKINAKSRQEAEFALNVVGVKYYKIFENDEDKDSYINKYCKNTPEYFYNQLSERSKDLLSKVLNIKKNQLNKSIVSKYDLLNNDSSLDLYFLLKDFYDVDYTWCGKFFNKNDKDLMKVIKSYLLDPSYYLRVYDVKTFKQIDIDIDIRIVFYK